MSSSSLFFFFNDTATTEIYTLPLHDALPILSAAADRGRLNRSGIPGTLIWRACLYWWWTITRRTATSSRVFSRIGGWTRLDRKSTRLNSSHLVISYAVFCLKKKKISASLAQQPSAGLRDGVLVKL